MRRRLLLILVILLCGLGIYTPIRCQRLRTEDGIRIAVFSHLFANNGSAREDTATAYYLSVVPGWAQRMEPGSTPLVDRMLNAVGLARQETDRWDAPSASSGLLKRFRGHKPPVRPASECWIRNATEGVTDTNGKKGVVFVTGQVKWINRNRVEVEAGYYENGLSASGEIYTLVRRHGRWSVIREELLWIS